MVMKKVTPVLARRGPRRVGIAEAKAKLSEVLRNVAQVPVVIHNRGHDVGALIDIDTYERLVAANDTDDRPGGKKFLAQVDELKRRYGGGVEDFAPIPANITPVSAFSSKRRRS
jgi:prevent-host-death family protein